MQYAEKSTVVDASVAASFRLWKRVEEWPTFLKAIRAVRRIDEKCFSLKSQRGGTEYESIAEISLVIPERRMAWRTISGVENSGVIVFEHEPSGKTRVTFQMQYETGAGRQSPKAMSDRLAFRLACFKEYIAGMNSKTPLKVSRRTLPGKGIVDRLRSVSIHQNPHDSRVDRTGLRPSESQ